MDINRDTLKEYFERGDRPTEEQFVDLIDSLINKEDDQVYVDGSKLHENAQIGLGAHRDANDPPVGDLELVRLYVDKRVSLNQLKVRGSNPAPGKLLFAKDSTGNVEWRDQTQLDQNHWERASFTDTNSNMWAKPTGNIGIGTNSPSSKLTISGTPPSVEKGLGLHIHNTRPAGNVQYTKASVSLLVQSGQSTSYRWEMASERQSPTASAFKLRRFTDGTDTTVAETYLSIGSDGNHVAFDTPGKFSFSRGNVGIGTISPAAKLHVAGDTLVTGLTQTWDLKISNLTSVNSAIQVLTFDASTGLVRKVDANKLQAAGYDLWTDIDESYLRAKAGRSAVIGRSLQVGENIRLNDGGIQKGGPHFSPTDLGLYSLVKGYNVRYVSFEAAHLFYTNPGNVNNTGDGTEPVVQMHPNYVNVRENLNLNAAHNFTVGWVKPFLFLTFKLSRSGEHGPGYDRDWEFKTTVSYAVYPGAVIAGFKHDGWKARYALGADGGNNFVIAEHDPNGNWIIKANLANNTDVGAEESGWFVDVMFVKGELADTNWPYLDRWQGG